MENGLITRAQEAKNKHEEAANNEVEQFNNLGEQINNIARVNWEYALAHATKHPDQVTSTAIGVGTDGKPVNMDL